ncbi:MAG TPA: hypothetical protein RMH99_14420 [Sandaracinaceae bacterium LLY-WYZ-13_1]|nr:hypothetical protein [Sandaracinaceae bacterium LLY-WYZ-13_1]
MATWSAVGRLEAAGGGARFGAFAGALADVWGDPEAPRRVRWPIAMRVGRVR